MAKDTITTAAGRSVTINPAEMHKMRTIAALSSSNVDRILGAVARTVTSLTEEQIGELSDAEFTDLVAALSELYRLPKAS